MKYVAVVAGACVLLLDALLLVALGQPVPLDGLVWTGVAWFEWVLLAPVVVRIAAAVPYRRTRRRRFFLVHIVAGVSVAVVHMAMFLLLRTVVLGAPGMPGEPTFAVILRWMPEHLTMDLLVYGGILLATQISLYLEASRKQEDERLALERWLAQAELDRYKLELPAHEVNARLLEIERAIVRDADRAELLIEEFGASLRQSLAAASAHTEIHDIAQAEDEVVEEVLPPALPMPLRLLLLFSILPAAHLVTGTLFALSAAVQNQPLSWGPLVRRAWASVQYFPVTLAMVWLGSHVRRLWPLVLAAAILPLGWHLGVVAAVDRSAAARDQLMALVRSADVVFFLGLSLGAYAHARYRASRAVAVELAQLEAAVLRTRAAILRLQLNPHFLFNTMNSVAALLEDDRTAAARMATQLRHFVIRVLESSDREQVPLSEELESLVDYVAIENIRFDGRVELSITADDDTRRALVPAFLLQPLVENALRHGLLPATGGRVCVDAAVRDGTLHINVSDNGRANSAEVPAREGVGLANTRARLAHMYGDNYQFDLAPRSVGLQVAIEVPYSCAFGFKESRPCCHTRSTEEYVPERRHP